MLNPLNKLCSQACQVKSCARSAFTVARGAGGSAERATRTAVLLGWVGASDRHLSKYSDLLLSPDIGFAEARRATAPTRDVFVTRRGLVSLARDLLEGLRDGQPAVVFCFSNGGAFVWGEALTLLASEPERYSSVQIDGVVYDSAPAVLSPTTAATALSESVRRVGGGHSVTGQLLAPVAYVGMWAWIVFIYAPFLNPRYRSFFPLLESDTRPALYIFSDADDVTDVDALVAHISARRARQGASIHECRFPDSAHVGHLRSYPVAYESAVVSFLEALPHAQTSSRNLK